jgi:hypothetical protein
MNSGYMDTWNGVIHARFHHIIAHTRPIINNRLESDQLEETWTFQREFGKMVLLVM